MLDMDRTEWIHQDSVRIESLQRLFRRMICDEGTYRHPDSTLDHVETSLSTQQSSSQAHSLFHDERVHDLWTKQCLEDQTHFEKRGR